MGDPEYDELEDIAFRGELPKWLALRAAAEAAGRGGSRNPKNEWAGSELRLGSLREKTQGVEEHAHRSADVNSRAVGPEAMFSRPPQGRGNASTRRAGSGSWVRAG